jgi:hypothetical protein
MPIKLQSSSGGSVTLDVPVTASNFNVTVPNASGTAMVSGNMPAFGAYAATGTSVSSGTQTKINFDTEDFDTHNCYSSSRFTPTVAGYYQISAMVAWPTSNTTNVTFIAVYKNGSAFRYLQRMPKTAQYIWLTGSTVVYCNGTTDYIEIYGYQDAGLSITTDNGIAYTWFTGVLVRAA